jgi:Na+/H+-dicarboxylate symporter
VNAVLMGLISFQAIKLLPHRTDMQAALPPGAAEAAGQIASGVSQVPTAGEWIANLLPTNPFRAAAEGAMVPLIIFMVLFALAIAKTPPESRATLLAFFRAVSEAMLTLVRWVIGLAPIGVFALMFSLTARTGIAVAGALGGYILAYSVASLVFVLLTYPIVAMLGRVPVARFAKATLPAQLIAFSSSSSIASLPALTEGAEDELALPKGVTRFVLPLAVSTFKYAAPVSWMVGSTFIAWFYGIDLGLAQIATIAFAAVVLSFATPGVPRGAFLMLTPLFVQIGLPPAGIGILIAVDAIPDLFATVLNVTGDMGVTAIVARFSAKA